MSLIHRHRSSVQRGPLFEDAGEGFNADDAKVRLLAYYLPQFHPIPQNDANWGKNFTEWTNVTRATPQFWGHHQPHLPGELGFYDLRRLDAIEAQVEMANRFGIYGFCVHYYWFSGQPVMETPLQLILSNKQLKTRFCINWANENWTKRWEGSDSEVILQQDYSPEGDLSFARSLDPLLSDPRYITIDGRPLIMIYRPTIFPDIKASLERWREYFLRRGYPNPYFVMPKGFDHRDPRILGFDAAAGFAPHANGFDTLLRRRWLKLYYRKWHGTIRMYDEMVEKALAEPFDFKFFPSVCPSWDNTARRGEQGKVFLGSSPAKYGRWLCETSKKVIERYNGDERLVFINAWNEWAEGAHLEPDRHYGYAYLNETARCLKRLSK